MTCQRQGCAAPATHRPVLLLWVHEGHSPARGELDLPVCAAHAATTTVADLVDDASWEVMIRNLRLIGKAAPRRELTQVEFMPL